VTAAGSAWVRDARTWPARSPRSSLVSRPRTNAAWRTAIACSRSAWDGRRLPRSRPGAAAVPRTSGSPSGTAPRRLPVPRDEARPAWPPSLKVQH
jgi:hypothetical protein